MYRIGFLAVALAIWTLGTNATAQAQKRVALVVGNSAYQHTTKLANPKNDASDMAEALKKQGFEVIEGFDLDKAAFDRKVREFSAALKGAEAGLFFYAGHGLQVAGQNYLVPTDAKAETEDALDWEMLKVDLIHRAMERSTNTNILLLDACRDNPLARNLSRAMGTRSTHVGRGLATIEGGVGTLISFSTQPGNVALDGTGKNSPYAGSLVKHLASASEDLNTILINVRRDVRRETQGQQIPWEHSSLEGRFYFDPTAPKTNASKPTTGTGSDAVDTWDRVKDTSTIAVLESYARRYPDTIYAEMAAARIAELRKLEAAASRAEQEKIAQRKAAEAEAQRLRAEAELKKQDPSPPKEIRLGVKVKTVDAETAQSLGLSEGRGAVVAEVAPGPAADAGLKAGDVVLSIDGRSVSGIRDFAQQVTALSPGSQMQVRIVRSRQEQTITIKFDPATVVPAVKHAPKPGWVEIACQEVSHGAIDRDVFAVGFDKGKFKAVRMRMERTDVQVTSVTVVYENGETENLATNFLVRQGEWSRPWDLRGLARTLQRVEMVYQAKSKQGRACLEGLQG